jgi:hypothetical protein
MQRRLRASWTSRVRFDLRYGDLEIREDLQEIGLELLVAPVQLVHQQHRRPISVRVHRLEQRAPEQKARAEETRLVGLLTPSLHQTNVHHLARVVPFVNGVARIQSLIALEPDEIGFQDGGEDFRHLGLAHSRFSFEKERLLDPERQEYRGGQPAVGNVLLPPQRLFDRFDGGESPGNGCRSLAAGSPGQRLISAWPRARRRR